jgi:hypothetical protein
MKCVGWLGDNMNRKGRRICEKCENYKKESNLEWCGFEDGLVWLWGRLIRKNGKINDEFKRPERCPYVLEHLFYGEKQG